ncbi:hypothetical protein TWF696_004705 [Orbilia brochopaga]|uniref:Uncharacterized protein n=1 Tax=Orbilia brochopaga TaxID=3140254 RepID=A0AAV9TVN8_9PEZI
MASGPYLITSFTRYTLEDHEWFPAPGTLIRARLPRLINGPGSGTSSQASSSCYTPETPGFSSAHFVIVLGTSPTDNGFVVSVYPIMSFSKYGQLPAAERVKSNPKLSIADKRLLLPLPHLKEDLSLESGWRQPETPKGFGVPLDCGQWINNRPAWLWAGTQVFELFYGQSYFVSVPSVTISSSELARIYSYIRATKHAFSIAQVGQGHSGGSSGHPGNPSKFSGRNSRGRGGPASRGHQQKSGKYQKNYSQSGSSNNQANHLSGYEGDSSPKDTSFALLEPTFDDDMELLDYLRSPERNDLAAYHYNSPAENNQTYDSSQVRAWLKDI